MEMLKPFGVNKKSEGDYMLTLLKYPTLQAYDVEIRPHDTLWFASLDGGGISTTEPVIHNYALSYAFSRFNRIQSYNKGPSYEEDLSQMNWYSTPARSLDYHRIRVTWNAIDDRTYTTEDNKFNKSNTPKMGEKYVLSPYPLTKFTCTVFSLQGEKAPRIIRLGKKRTPCTVHITKQWNMKKVRRFETLKPSHLVNPLDVVGEIESYRMVMIPPSFITEETTISNGIGLVDGNKALMIPLRLLNKQKLSE